MADSQVLFLDDDENVDWLHKRHPVRFSIYQGKTLMARCNIETSKIETKDSELEEFFYLLVDEGLDGDAIGIDDGPRFVETMKRAGYEARPDETQQTADCDEEKKLTHKEVNYEETAKGKDQCKRCAHYHASTPDPNEDENQSCQIVQSPVMPSGWCKEFKRATQDASTPDVFPNEPKLEATNWDFQGLKINIENLRGSTRHGKSHHTRLTAPYGYIKGSSGADGDEVDVFVGAVATAPYAFIIHTKDPVTGEYDEDKVILGCEGAREAKQLFDENYDRPGFFESMEKMSIDQLKEKLSTLRGKKITA